MLAVPSVPIAAVPARFRGTLAEVRALLKAHYLRLGAASRRLRFLMPASDRSVEVISDRAAPESVLRLEIDGVTRGVLEIAGFEGGHAEIAISVEDGFQGKGHGRRLFEAGLTEAARMGVRTADLLFAADNLAIRRLARSAGGVVSARQGEWEAHIDVAAWVARQ